jgi:predicted DNA-binding protein with PD1-like motif
MLRRAFDDNAARKTDSEWYTTWQVTTLKGTTRANDKGKRKYHYHVMLGTTGYSLMLRGY